ncbi:MAG: hypothetical protein AABY64_07470 [Bdellovibrionota bacterium]
MNQNLKKAFLGSVLILSGCASMTDRRRHQYVYIQSVPAGAVILDKGKNIGSTPGLVRLHRDKKYVLELQRAGEQKIVTLDTKYSWNESFAGNLVLLSLAPVGWITDLVTGTAWTYQDPEPAQFSNKSIVGKTKVPRLALAPPLTESFGLSDEVAQYWEKQLPKLYPSAQLIPFKDSLSIFQETGFDYDERPNDEQQYRQLLFNLPADLIFLADVREGQGVANLHAELKDLSGKIIEEKSAEAPFLSTTSWKSSALGLMPRWFQFIPNTVGMEFSNTQTYLSDSLVTYNSVEAGRKSSMGKALTYLQALTLSRLQMPRIDRQARWRFMLTPSGRLSYQTIYFPEFVKLANVEFDYLQIGIGIGPEVGYQSGKHYTYMKGIPLWTYSKIDWHQPGGHDQSMEVGNISFQFEFGYLYFLNDRMSIRYFAKSTGTGIELWNSVAQRVNPTTPLLTSASTGYAGLAFGYTFDLSNRLVK